MIFEVPLSPGAQAITVPVLSTAYVFTIQYREASEGGWVVDISSRSGDAILSGLPLVTGADLLAQHASLGFGFELRVATDGDPDAVPAYADLGNPCRLYIITP